LTDTIQSWIDRHERLSNKLASVGDIRRTEDENTTLYAWKKREVRCSQGARTDRSQEHEPFSTPGVEMDWSVNSSGHSARMSRALMSQTTRCARRLYVFRLARSVVAH